MLPVEDQCLQQIVPDLVWQMEYICDQEGKLKLTWTVFHIVQERPSFNSFEKSF